MPGPSFHTLWGSRCSLILRGTGIQRFACSLTRSLSLPLIFNPGLRERLRPSRSAHFPQGTWLQELGGSRPLRKMTSAAYGFSQDSTAKGVAVDCPVSPFFATAARLGVLPGEERAHPARPDLRIGRSRVLGSALASASGSCAWGGPGESLRGRRASIPSSWRFEQAFWARSHRRHEKRRRNFPNLDAQEFDGSRFCAA